MTFGSRKKRVVFLKNGEKSGENVTWETFIYLLSCLY